MDWKSVLGSVAPTIATVLGGPLAGLAVDAVGKALGMSDATQDKIKDALQQGQMTGDQIVAMKQAELALQSKLKELDIKVEEIAAADRDSARKLQTETKSRIPGMLAILITVGFFGILIGMMYGVLKPADNQALLILLGALAAAWGAVVNFYYGSSAGSESKNALLAAKK